MEELVANKCMCGGTGELLQIQNNPVEYNIRCGKCCELAVAQSNQETLIEIWNKINPKLSKAMQILYWLETGKFITTVVDTNIRYMYLEKGTIYLYFKDGLIQLYYINSAVEHTSYTELFKHLANNEWRVYTEERYTETFEQAIQSFLEGKSVHVYIFEADYYIEFITSDYISLKNTEEHCMNRCIQRSDREYEILKRSKWLIK